MKPLLALIPCVLFSSVALAGADCPKYPQEEWMNVLDLQKKIVNEYGFIIKQFKIDDECYEIYGWERGEDGKLRKIEVYFDARSGAIVEKELD